MYVSVTPKPSSVPPPKKKSGGRGKIPKICANKFLFLQLIVLKSVCWREVQKIILLGLGSSIEELACFDDSYSIDLEIYFLSKSVTLKRFHHFKYYYSNENFRK